MHHNLKITQTMKSIKYLLISLFALFGASEVYACWGPWYTPRGYYMYRVNNQSETSMELEGYYPGSERNCKEWQIMTSTDIPLEDIYQVVYKMTLDEFERIYDNKEANGNKFIEWITQKDTSILDFLLLAKTNEYIRLKRNSRWYYPSMKIGARMTIEEIAEKALNVNVPKLRDRYLLQAIRALFSLGRYEECINLWDSEVVSYPEENLMRQLIHPYIAGAEFRVKRSEKAITYFAELGDVGSMLFCAGRAGEIVSTIDALALVCEYAPNSRHIEETLQSFVRELEPLGEFYWEDDYEESIEVRKLYNLSLKMAESGKSDNPGMWYYTAAFLSDLRGDVSNASYLIGLAEKSKKSDYIGESIKVFRMYIYAKTQPYNSSYESKLFSQLKWLDAKIVNCINDEVRKETASGYKLSNYESFYYWNDMMRRILLAEVCPRMIKARKTTRALQLANMADNRLLGLVNRQDYTDWVETDTGWEEKVIEFSNMNDYRYSEKFNKYDYRNSFFEMIDSIGLDEAIKYVDNVTHSKSEFDFFLNSRGYTGIDYLNDIIGTQCLRNLRYGDAVKYLGIVSEKYKHHHNVYMEYDPFSFDRKRIKNDGDFRYDFAIKMHSLEHNINITSEPNRKARLILQYAIGIQNSFDRCWGLTQYYRGTSYWGQVCEKRDWENDVYTKVAKEKAQKLINSACAMVTDDEVAADLHYELCHYITIVENYPNTQRGIYVRGNCDNLKDYRNSTTIVD